MKYPPSTAPTRYEVSIEALPGAPPGIRDGAHLFCYIAGSPSFSSLLRAVRDYGPVLVDIFGVTDLDDWSRTRGRRASLRIGQRFRVQYTGRTQREAIGNAQELPTWHWITTPQEEIKA